MIRKETSILAVLLALTVALCFAPAPEPVVQEDVPESPALSSNVPAVVSSSYSPAGNVPHLPGKSTAEENFSNWVVRQTVSRLFKDKEGSYTNFFDAFRSSSPKQVNLQSDWITTYLFPEQILPKLNMRVTRDPETGEYTISGGTLSLPGTGLEAGYEIDDEERKATLHWQKSF